MTDKKDPGKFTIRFNICDPQHKAEIAASCCTVEGFGSGCFFR